MPKSFIKDPRCRLCNSPLRPAIEAMFAKGDSYADIMAYAQKHGMKLHKSSLWRHNKKHRMPSRLEHNTEKEMEKEQEREGLTIVSSIDFINRIIAKAMEGLIDGTLKPSLIEGLKAVELKTKISEGSIFERELLKYIAELSTGDERAAAVKG